MASHVERIGVQIVVGSIFAVLALMAKVTLAKQFGIAGIAWGTLLAYLSIIVPYGRIVRRRLGALDKINAAAMANPAGQSPS